MTEKKNETTEKQEVKLPQLHFGYMATCYVHTDKGMCMWMTPSHMTDLPEIISYLDFTKAKYEAQIELNKKTAKEAAEKKSDTEDKKEKYKSV